MPPIKRLPLLVLVLAVMKIYLVSGECTLPACKARHESRYPQAQNYQDKCDMLEEYGNCIQKQTITEQTECSEEKITEANKTVTGLENILKCGNDAKQSTIPSILLVTSALITLHSLL